MRNLLKPKWLLVINILPLVILFILLYSQFRIISSLLSEESIQLWQLFSSTLGVIGMLNLAYVVYLIWKKKEVSKWYAYLALIIYIPFVYLYGYHIDDIIPFSIPQWMISGNIFLYVGTFLMPTLAYCLIVLVAHFTPDHIEHKAWLNFLIAISVPLLCYLFSQIILPLWQPIGNGFDTHLFLILLLAITLVFLFFLIRTIYIVAIKKAQAWQKYQLVWKIPLAIILPVLGLMINNGHIFNDFGGVSSGVFGNFSSIWFYLLALINGVLICLPNLEHRSYRLILYIGRSISFAYTFYFFLVFLPFLPLSVVAILAVGAGFLMLVPLLLFVLYLNQLVQDYIYLKPSFSKSLILGATTVSFLILPLMITIDYFNDKVVLEKALTYLYSPDYSKEYKIDNSSLSMTLQHIKNHKNSRGMGGIFENETPYLSSYFNWLVLDNLSLPNAKIKRIESVFFGKEVDEPLIENIRNDQVEISSISSQSTYDEDQKAWESWVDIEITNYNQHTRFSEYATTIELPQGCWISNYYLFVGDRKELGILAEKKSAMWIFSQIRNENKDPGILYYLTGNKVAFRIFPFTEGEVRKTGISFLHKDPITLNIDDHEVRLGKEEVSQPEIVEAESIVYIPANQKKKLKSVKRQPYYHFLVDISKGRDEDVIDLSRRINQLLASSQELSQHARISFVNSYVSTMKLEDNWENAYSVQDFEGGFYLDRAIRKTLVDSYKEKNEQYPILVVLTDSLQKAVLDNSYADLEFIFPESDFFYYLNKEGNLEAHTLMKNPLKAIPEIEQQCRFCENVLEYRFSNNSVAYVANDGQPSVILKNGTTQLKEEKIIERDWLSALKMQGLWNSQLLQPERLDTEWLTIVKYSFLSKIMMPVTSYLVVENEAQKAMLKKKQEEVLSGNPLLDPGEEAERMTEPSWILLVLLLALVVWYRERRRGTVYN